MRREWRRRGSSLAVFLISIVLTACSVAPAPTPTPTFEPVLPPLPSATPLAAAPPPAATSTPVPLGQGGTPGQPSTPIAGGAPAGGCPAGAAARLPGLRYGVSIAPGTAIDRALDQARDMNAGWVRATLHWSDLEPQQG